MAEVVRVWAVYNATDPSQLSLNVGEVIEVQHKYDDVWWYGRRVSDRLVGFFPATYVEPVPVAPINNGGPFSVPLQKPNPFREAANTQNGHSNKRWSYVETQSQAIYEQPNYYQTPTTIAQPSLSISRSNVASNAVNAKQNQPTKNPIEDRANFSSQFGKGSSQQSTPDYVIAIESYESERDDEMDIEIGDRICVRERRFEKWWRGVNERTGAEGLFPSSIVQRDAVLKSSQDNTEQYIVIVPFEAQRDDDLELELNDIIHVSERKFAKWWRGTNQRTGDFGLFPSNAVQPYTPKTTFLHNKNISQRTNLLSHSNNPPIIPILPVISPMAKSQSVFDLRQSNIAVKQPIYPKQKIKEQRPFNEKLEKILQQGPTKQQPNLQLRRNSQTHVWPILEDSIDNGFSPFGGSVSSEKSDPISEDNISSGGSSEYEDIYGMRILNSSSNTNQDNQQHNSQQRFYVIYELFQTECKYLTELDFTIKNFHQPIKASGLIPNEDVEVIFASLAKIYSVNYEFYSDLANQCQGTEDSSEQKIGALFTSHMQRMLPIYQNYCTSNVAELSIKIDENEQFSEDLVQISTKQNSYQTLRSGLIRPMQRIMRYRLLIEKIANLTPDTHCDQLDCTQALEYVKVFCEQINIAYDKACLQWEPFKRISWIQKHLTMSSKNVDQIIDFNSETLFLGPRVLLHSGILYHHSTILFAFLFNDILVLATTKCKNIHKIANGLNVFEHKETRNLKCALYEKPFLLKDLKISDTNSFGTELNSKLFRMVIKSDKKEISLKAWSTEDWIVWMQQVSRAKHSYDKMEKHFFRIDQKQPKVLINEPIAILSLSVIEAYQLYSRNYALNAYCKIAMGKDWSTAHSLLTSQTERKIMDFRKAKEGILSMLQAGTRRSLAFSSNRFNEQELDDAHRTRWSINKQIMVYDCTDILMIHFFDSNPYAPHQYLGEVKVPFAEFMQKQNYVTNQTTERDFPIVLPSEMLSKNFMYKLNVNPYIVLKYEFTIFTNLAAIRRLGNLNDSFV